MPDRVGSEMNFDGNRFWFGGDQGFEVIEVETGTTPHKIDFWGAGTAVQGVYQISDAMLTVCSAPPGVSRPKEMEPCSHPLYILTQSQRSRAQKTAPVP